MKIKRIGVIGFVVVVIVLFSFVTIKTATKLYGNKSDNNYSIEREDIKDKYIQYKVGKGELVIEDELEGKVVFDNSLVTQKYDINKRNKVLINVGDEINKGDTLVEGDVKLEAKVSGKIVDITNDGNIVIIDFSKTSIKVRVPEYRQKYINGSLKVSTQLGNEESQSVKIKKIESTIEEGCLSILIENKYRLLENSCVDVRIEYEVKKDVVSVPSSFVRNVSGEAYVSLLVGDEVKEMSVQVGEKSNEDCEIIKGDNLIGKIIVVDKKELMMLDVEEGNN